MTVNLHLIAGSRLQSRSFAVGARQSGQKSGSSKQPPGKSQSQRNINSKQQREKDEKRLKLFKKSNQTTDRGSKNVKASQQPPNVSSSIDKTASPFSKYVLYGEPIPEHWHFEYELTSAKASVVTSKPITIENLKPKSSKKTDSKEKDKELAPKPKRKKKMSAKKRAKMLKKITLNEYGPLTEFDFSEETNTDIEPNKEMLEEVIFNVP